MNEKVGMFFKVFLKTYAIILGIFALLFVLSLVFFDPISIVEIKNNYSDCRVPQSLINWSLIDNLTLTEGINSTEIQCPPYLTEGKNRFPQ